MSSTKTFLLTHCCNTYSWDRLENHRYFNFQPVHLVMVSTAVSDHFISWDLCSTFIWFKCSFYLHCEGLWSQAYDTHMTPNSATKSSNSQSCGCRNTAEHWQCAGTARDLRHSPASLLLPTGFVCWGWLCCKLHQEWNPWPHLWLSATSKDWNASYVHRASFALVRPSLCHREEGETMHQWMPLLAFGVTSSPCRSPACA